MRFAVHRLPLAFLLTPALSVLAALIAVSDIPIRVPEAYAVGLTGEAMTPVFLIAPLAAACAAWEAGRLRRAGWHLWPHVRSMAAVALRALFPVMLMAVVALSVALGATLKHAGVIVMPDFRLLAKSIGIIAAHCLLGYAIGLRLPTIVATASVLIVDYAWMVLPISVGPLWLRHLNGTWISCCAVYVDIAPEAWWAAMAVGAGIATAGLVLMSGRGGVGRISLASIALIGALILGSNLVSSLGPDPVQPRPISELVCSATEPRVCVWPEHRDRLAEVSELIVRAASAWSMVGFAVAGEYTEQRTGLEKDAASFGFSPQSRAIDIVAGLANRSVPPGRCGPTASPQHDPRDYIRAFMLRAAAIDPGLAGYPADVALTVDSVRGQPNGSQRDWLARLLRCEPPTAIP